MRLTIGAAGLLIGLLVACGGDNNDRSASDGDARQSASGIAGRFVGKVEGTNAFIGIVVLDTRETLAYVCDSDKITQWFRGNAGEDSLDLSAPPARLEANLSIKGASGKVTLKDGTFAFTAKPAEGDEGLYRATEVKDDFSYVGGWILLPGSEQRGVVTGTPILSASLSATATAEAGGRSPTIPAIVPSLVTGASSLTVSASGAVGIVQTLTGTVTGGRCTGRRCRCRRWRRFERRLCCGTYHDANADTTARNPPVTDTSTPGCFDRRHASAALAVPGNCAP